MPQLFLKLCLPACLSAVALLAGCSTPSTSASLEASNRQIAGVLPVQRHFDQKSDRWYDIRRNESVSFGAWRTGTIDRDYLTGERNSYPGRGLGWVKQKTGTTLQFDLHTPHCEVCNVSINSVRKDRELGVGPVIMRTGITALSRSQTGARGPLKSTVSIPRLWAVAMSPAWLTLDPKRSRSEKTTAGIRWPVSFPGLAAPRSAGTGIRPAESTSTVKV